MCVCICALCIGETIIILYEQNLAWTEHYNIYKNQIAVKNAQVVNSNNIILILCCTSENIT